MNMRARRHARDSTTQSAIHIEGMSFSYGAQLTLAIGDLQIAAGAHTLIYGESGCGKSTLLNLLSGILTGHSGSIKVLGTDYADMSAVQHDRFRAQNIGVIFQQFNLIPYLSVYQNVLLGARFSGHKVDKQRMQAIFEHLQIAPLLEKRAVALSHGQQQRVAAARALVQKTPLILADEPTSALDDKNASLFLDLLFREAEENRTTIVVVSHDLRYRSRFDQTIDLAQRNDALSKTTSTSARSRIAKQSKSKNSKRGKRR